VTRIVIMGGGPAGYEAALVAAQHGGDVTVVERDGMGGACVLDDCVPSKTLIASAGVRVELGRAPDLGFTVDRNATGVDLPRVNARVASLAMAQSADVRARVEREGVRIIRGSAAFADEPSARGLHAVEAVGVVFGHVVEHDEDLLALLLHHRGERAFPREVLAAERQPPPL
jgi:dihydrolipoamide dehydrogenase